MPYKDKENRNARAREHNREPGVLVAKHERERRFRANHPDYYRGYYENNKEKWRERDLPRKYGISIDDYNHLFAEQGGRCAICNRHQGELKKSLAVDHDHETGKIRGLLCHRCNSSIGLIDDSSDVAMRMTEYLGGHDANSLAL